MCKKVRKSYLVSETEDVAIKALLSMSRMKGSMTNVFLVNDGEVLLQIDKRDFNEEVGDSVFL